MADQEHSLVKSISEVDQWERKRSSSLKDNNSHLLVQFSLSEEVASSSSQSPDSKEEKYPKTPKRCKSLSKSLSLKPDLAFSPDESSRAITAEKLKQRHNLQGDLTAASKSKQQFFQLNFQSFLPEGERLLTEYSCAYLKPKSGLLRQGRMFISENHLYFYAKILTSEVKLVIAFGNVVKMKKCRIARLFPTGIEFIIQAQREEKKHLFTSFTKRRQAFALLQLLISNCHKNTKLSPDQFWSIVGEPMVAGRPLEFKSFAFQEALELEELDSSESNDSSEIQDALPIRSLSFVEAETDEVVMPEGVCFSHTHPSHEFVNAVLPVTPDQLWQMLFSPNSSFMQQFCKADNLHNVLLPVWTKLETNASLEDSLPQLPEFARSTHNQDAFVAWRQVEYKISHVLRHVYTHEYQRRLWNSENDGGFTVLAKVVHIDRLAPNDFFVEKMFCVRRVDDEHCRLRIFGHVNFPEIGNFIVRRLLSLAPKELVKHFNKLHHMMEDYIQEHQIHLTKKLSSSYPDMKQSAVPSTLDPMNEEAAASGALEGIPLSVNAPVDSASVIANGRVNTVIVSHPTRPVRGDSYSHRFGCFLHSFLQMLRNNPARIGIFIALFITILYASSTIYSEIQIADHLEDPLTMHNLKLLQSLSKQTVALKDQLLATRKHSLESPDEWNKWREEVKLSLMTVNEILESAQSLKMASAPTDNEL